VWTLAVLWTKAPAWELELGIGHWGLAGMPCLDLPGCSDR
jgi:hypothetical protein